MNLEDKSFNPFPGLRAFEEDEDILFFGREKQIDELLRKLRLARFLAIIGSSGSGKSSLVKSGLLPSLHSGMMSGGVGSQWRMAIFRPGNDPISEMNKALSMNGILRVGLTEEDLEVNKSINEALLRRSNLGLVEAYKLSGLDKKINLLVLVDQFEEIFRFSKYEKAKGESRRDSIAFINLLLHAAEQNEFPIYIVITMRSDFLGDCTEFRGLPEALNEGQYLIPRMTRDERRDAITGPIGVGGAKIAPALLNRLLNDVGDNPDQLPLLQHALMRTWDAWKARNEPSSPIGIEDYERIGTISEALSQHADEAYDELATDREKLICQIIFRELTDRGGLQSGIRRPQMVSELCDASGASFDEVTRVVEVFRKAGRGFLMPPPSVPLTERSIIDISHESIMRVWIRLISWLKNEEEDAKIYLDLCEAARKRQAPGHSDIILTGPELQIALKWIDNNPAIEAWSKRYNDEYDSLRLFLEYCRNVRDKEIKHKENQARLKQRNARRINIAFMLFGILSSVLAFWAVDNYYMAQNKTIAAITARKDAEKQRERANIAADEAKKSLIKAIRAESYAEAEKETADMEKAKAVEALKNARYQKTKADEQAGIAKRETENAKQSLQKAIEATNEAKKQTKKAEDNEHTAKLEENRANGLTKLAQSKNLANEAIMMNEIDYNKCLKLSLNAYEDHENSGGDFQDNAIYNALYVCWRNSKQISDSNHFKQHKAPVRSLAGLNNRQIVFSGDETGKIIMLRNDNGILRKIPVSKKYPELFAGAEIRDLIVSPGGSYLLAVSLSDAVVFNLRKLDSNQKFQVHFSGYGRHGAFLNDTSFVIQSSGKLVRFHINGKPVKIDSILLPECSLFVAGKNRRLFTCIRNKIYEYSAWGKIPGNPEDSFDVKDKITSLGMDESGRYLAAGTIAGKIWVKDLGNKSLHPIEKTGYHQSAINDIKLCTLSDTVLQLATASSDRTIKLAEIKPNWEIYIGNVIDITDNGNWVRTLCYSNNGKYLYSGGEDQQVVVRPTTMQYIYSILK